MDHEYEDEEQDSLPHEIIYEILLRLPVKSLTRFRSISPLWNSTISDPSFARSHFSRSLCRRSDGSSGGATTLLLTFTHRFNAERLIFSVQIPADRDHSDAPVHQLTISGYSHPYVSQSLRGLICLNLGSICVCNPSTRKFVKLPWTGTEAMAGGSSSSPPAFALHRNNLFGFDPVGNEHKVLDTWVRFTNLDDPYKDLVMEHRVFTTGTNRWRRVEDGPPHFPLDKSVCIDGRIYYVAITSSSKNSEDVVLVAFDVARECFNFIKVPDEIGENLEISIFMEYEGHLALVDYQGLKNGNKDLAIWILEDEQEEKWVKNNIGLPVKWSEIKKNSNLDFAGTTHMGELIFAPWNMERPFYIFFFDIKKSSLRKVEISDMPEFECNALMNVRTNNHVESILPVDVA